MQGEAIKVQAAAFWSFMLISLHLYIHPLLNVTLSAGRDASETHAEFQTSLTLNNPFIMFTL